MRSRTLRANHWIGTLSVSMMMVILWLTSLVLVPRDGPLDEAEASSLSAWAQGYQKVRKNLRDSVTGQGCYKPESVRFEEKVPKTLFTQNHEDEVETSAHHFERKRKNTAQNQKAYSLLPLSTTWTLGESVRIKHQRTTPRRHVSSCQETPVHSSQSCFLHGVHWCV